MLTTYVPRSVALNDWLVVREFVIACVLRVAPRSALLYARSYLSRITRFVVWCTNELLLPLDAAEMFHPAHIARFARTFYSGHSQRDVEARLSRVAEVVTGERSPRRLREPASRIEPYTRKEMRDFLGWAATQKTEALRLDAGAILALCNGAGLRSTEAMNARVRDVLTDIGPHTGGTFVHVADRTHQNVPVRSRLAHFLHDVVAARDADDWLVFPTRNGDTQRVYDNSRFSPNAGEPPVPARLRNTWLLHLLNAMPLPDVIRASDLRDLGTLRGYTAWFASTDDDIVIDRLLNGEANGTD